MKTVASADIAQVWRPNMTLLLKAKHFLFTKVMFYLKYSNYFIKEFPGSPLVKTWLFCCCGPKFHPWSGELRFYKSPRMVQLFGTPWTVTLQAPLSMGFPWQEYWSGLPFPSPEDPSDWGIKPASLALQKDSLPSEPPGKCASKHIKVKLLHKRDLSIPRVKFSNNIVLAFQTNFRLASFFNPPQSPTHVINRRN